MKNLVFIGVIFLASIGGLFAQQTSANQKAETDTYKYRINDAHCHFVNFIQKTDGIDVLLDQMDKAAVDNIVLFGIPVTKL